jgi:hypothetical protein
VIATTVVPATDGTGWCVHLFNAGDTAADVNLHWTDRERVAIFLSSLFQDRREEIRGPVSIPGGGILMLKVERR